MNADFAVFILTHGRADNVKTYATLRRQGYTGSIYLIVDDLDSQQERYKELYENEVIVFDKKNSLLNSDPGHYPNNLRTILYARNASFGIAKSLGIKYFMQMDDDYVNFEFKFTDSFCWVYRDGKVLQMDFIFKAMVDFMKLSQKITSLAMMQSGDYIGGSENSKAKAIILKRKAMNSFLCSTDRPFKFTGHINEDVCTYTLQASQGKIFFSTNQVSLHQTITQANSGGMTDTYLESGTYVKSFYSVIFMPSAVKVAYVASMNRLHHDINWNACIPMILDQKHKKTS